MMGVLKETSLASAGGRRASRLRRSTVGVQVALSVVLLVVAGLLVRSLATLHGFDPGFRTDRLVLAEVDTRAAGFGPAEAHAFTEITIERLRGLPGVEDATGALVVPLSTTRERRGFRIPGYAPPNGRPYVSIDYNIVGPRYFELMGIPIVQGIGLDAATTGNALAVVINEAAAGLFWGGRDPVGQMLTLAGDNVTLQVVGVARTLSYYEVGEAPRPYIYVSAAAVPAPPLTLHVRARARADALLATVEREIEAVDPRVMSVAYSFEQMRSLPLFPARALASLASVFGGIALVLCMVGLYGVVASSVGQRTREIGVRLAFGAQPRDLVRSVLREPMGLVAIGGVAGLALAGGAAQALGNQLFQVSPLDPLTYAGVFLLLAAIALLASWGPARRAARIDPVRALREG
jgi:predicted permease